MTILGMLLVLIFSNCVFYVLAWYLVNSYENTLEIVRQDVIDLDRYCTRLENTVKYLSQIRVEKESVFGKNGSTISQHYLDLPELEVKPIVVPYTTLQVVNGVQYRVYYNQIWDFEDWHNSQNGKYWVKNKTEKKGRTYVKGGKWVDELYKGDEILDYLYLDFDVIKSDLPCKWEYKGYAELDQPKKRSTKRRYAVSGV